MNVAGAAMTYHIKVALLFCKKKNHIAKKCIFKTKKKKAHGAHAIDEEEGETDERSSNSDEGGSSHLVHAVHQVKGVSRNE